MGNQIDTGIGRSAREVFSPNQPTPHGDFQNFGIHLASVVDDVDEMAMGRVWLYIPGISARNPNIEYARYSPTRNPPNDDGTPGTPIEDKRQGFIRAYPMVPHAGSDRMRESGKQPDGRNPQTGQSNGYGDFHQARNGDLVAVCFMGGDPSRAYIMGHIPMTAETNMVPSYSVAQTNASGAGISTNVGPAYNKGPDNQSHIPSSTLFHNLTDSGLIQDSLRGAGSSSSTRETPSRVRGMKTPGDPDTNMMGHQFVMDDHPDSQLMRFRTSKGAQVLLCDNGDFIYLSTCTGKTWLQIDDGGNVNIFAHSSVSVHSEADINYTCDRDFNLHIGGNANWVVKGSTNFRSLTGMNITVGEGGGDFDITVMNNMMFKVQGSWTVGAQRNVTLTTAKELDMASAADMNFKVGANFHTESQKATNIYAKQSLEIQSDGEGDGSGPKLNIFSKKAMEIQSKDAFSMKVKKAIGMLSTDEKVQIEGHNGTVIKDGSNIKLDAPSITSTVSIPIGPGVSGLSINDIADVPAIVGGPNAPTNMITARGGTVLNFASPPPGLQIGAEAFNHTNPDAIISGQTVQSVSGNQVTLSGGVDEKIKSGDKIQFGPFPVPNQADISLDHSVTSPPQTSGPPTSPTSVTKYATPIVPQHEPWSGHPAAHPGYNTAVNPKSIPKLT